MGRGRPWSFRKRPQALHRTDPVSSRRQSGVVLVAQFWHTGYDHVSERSTADPGWRESMRGMIWDDDDDDDDGDTSIDSR